MKKVKIIVGTYGYRKNDTSPVELIDKNSDPIEVPDAEAKRLIGLGIATAVEAKAVAPTPAAAPESKEAESPEAEVPMVTGHLDAESLKEYSYNDLKKLAKDLGLSAKGSKEELIERIAAAQVQAPATEDDGTGEGGTEDDGTDADNEEPPVLSAVDPE